MIFHDGIDIGAPMELVWRTYTDVERWPTWTASMTAVDLAGDGPLALGSAATIAQPRLPRTTWTVTELTPGRSWTWTARAPGATTVATHVLTPTGPATTRVDQSIEQRGPLGALVGVLARGLTRRYLALEAAGLKAICEERAGTGPPAATEGAESA